MRLSASRESLPASSVWPRESKNRTTWWRTSHRRSTVSELSAVSSSPTPRSQTFPLDANDNPILFVLGGRSARRLRDILVWLVLHFITFERLLPGVQTWPGHKRAA